MNGYIEKPSLASPDAVADSLAQLKDCILVDVRPHGEFVKQHIRGAVHLHLNSMQLRRLCKGICELDTVVADQSCKEVLQRRFASDVELVLYDENSGEDLVTPCIKNYLDILRRGIQGSLYVLNGEYYLISVPVDAIFVCRVVDAFETIYISC